MGFDVSEVVLLVLPSRIPSEDVLYQQGAGCGAAAVSPGQDHRDVMSLQSWLR